MLSSQFSLPNWLPAMRRRHRLHWSRQLWTRKKCLLLSKPARDQARLAGVTCRVLWLRTLPEDHTLLKPPFQVLGSILLQTDQVHRSTSERIRDLVWKNGARNELCGHLRILRLDVCFTNFTNERRPRDKELKRMNGNSRWRGRDACRLLRLVLSSLSERIISPATKVVDAL